MPNRIASDFRGPYYEANEEGFSPVGNIAIYVPRGHAPIELGSVVLNEIATLSTSSHRDVYRVLGLGRCVPFGFTRSSHTFGGTLEFRVLHEEAFMEALKIRNRAKGILHATELPPFDIISLLMNDRGDVGFKTIKGVCLVDEGMIIGVDLPIIQQTYTFIAADILPLAHLVDQNYPLLSTLSEDPAQIKVPVVTIGANW